MWIWIDFGTRIGIRVSGILWILWIQWTQTTSVVCFILLFLLVASFLPPGRRMEAMVVEFDTFDSHPFVPTQWGLRDSVVFQQVSPCTSLLSLCVQGRCNLRDHGVFPIFS